MRSMSIESTKRSIRREMKAVCKGVRPEVCGQAGIQMASFLAHMPEFEAGHRLGLFASSQGEPDTRPLFELIVSSGREAFFPRCRPDGTLDFVSTASWCDLTVGRFGILEPPAAARPVDLTSIDLFLVPGLAFDRRGGRLGRGGGFYDRSLSHSSPLFGLALSLQWVDFVPMAEHDRKMRGVLTEEGLTRVQD